MNIAVLMTTFNRAQVTLDCLGLLMNQSAYSGNRIEVFLVDAESPDDTRKVVESAFPSVYCSTVSRNVFWNHGMITAYNLAASARDSGGEHQWDYFLLLNDDTFLYPEAVEELLLTGEAIMANTGRAPVIVGAVCDSATGKVTYGGMNKRSFLGSLRPGPFHDLVSPTRSPQFVDTCNANCLLIHRDVINDIGFLDSVFSHGYGDTDFGYRATRAGHPLVMTGSFVGTCSLNSRVGSTRDFSLPLTRRIKVVTGPKGVPLREWFAYTRRHGGLSWPYHFVRPYAHAVIGGTIASVVGFGQQGARRLRNGSQSPN